MTEQRAHTQPSTEQVEFIETLIEQRRDYLASRNFIKAATIQENLARLGIELTDTAEGTRWRTS